jgi:HlyD family secretion protein
MLIILSIALLAGVLAACGSAEATPTAEPAANAAKPANVVSAEAFVAPLQEADLAFEVGGRLASVEVKEGDQVEKGAVLAKLDGLDQQAGLAEAEANLQGAKAQLTQAEANLEQAKSQLAVYEATTASNMKAKLEAEANLAKVKAPPTEEKIAQLEANLNRAEAALAEIIAGPTKEDIDQARAGVASAQANLNKVLAKARSEDLQAASARMLQAEAEVRLAQADYDKFVYGDPKVAEPFGVALQKATLNYQAAKADYDKLVNGATPEDIAIGRAGVAEAQAALNKVLAGATPEQIAQAQAEVTRAEADLADLKAGATAEDIAIAEAGVAQAQAGVEIAQANAEAHQSVIAQAEAGVEAAKTGVEQAEAGKQTAAIQVAKTSLIAPFAGTVSRLPFDAGEIVQAGSAVVALGDASVWQIETDDLTEIDVVNVRVGAGVTISVDALPGEQFEGKVVRVTPKAETKAGDQTYTVLIDITKGDTSKLRWGMTTFVDIQIGPEL